MSQAVPFAPPVLLPTASFWLMFRMSVMMFLQFAIQGAWLPLLFQYFMDHRHFDAPSVSIMLAFGAIGAVVSPFIAGQLADRYMNAEHFMTVAHLVGAVVVWVFAEVTDFYLLVGLSFLYGVLYTPTIATANAIAFAHLPDRDRDYGKVRVWGTVGWICVGIGIGQWLLFKAGTDQVAQVAGMRDAFRLAAVLGVVQAAFAFTLPKTPPQREVKSYAPGAAMVQIRRQPLLTIFLVAIPIAAVHQFFFVRTSQYLRQLNLNAPLADRIFGVGGAGIMTIGQISELIVIGLLMPVLAKRIPRKVLLSIGLLAYFARFMIFAYLPYKEALLPALALHGIVFGCFFFVCIMIVDERTTAGVRASAQNLFNLVVFGVGVILGNLMAGWVDKWTSVGGQTNWQAYYAIPGWVTLGCLLALLVFYRTPRPESQDRGFEVVTTAKA
jgi:nucleoside transporter